MSLQSKLLTRIQKDGTTTYGSLVQLTMEEGYKISTMDRRLREHAEDGLIFPVFAKSRRNTSYISAYTAKPIEIKKQPITRIVDKNGVPTAVVTYS